MEVGYKSKEEKLSQKLPKVAIGLSIIITLYLDA